MTSEPIAKKIDETLRKLATQRNVEGRVKVLVDHDSPMLRKIMIYGNSPYIKFGVKIGRTEEYDLLSTITRHPAGAGLDIDDPSIWKLLDDLRTSTASSATKLLAIKNVVRYCGAHTGTILVSILGKNVAKNVSASTVNKAWPDSIPVFSVQLAQKYADKKVKQFPQYVEMKYDGVRAASIIHPSGDVEVLTRTGRPIPAAAYFTNELQRIGRAYDEVIDKPAGRKYEGCVTDGELCGDTFNDAVSIFRSEATATSGSYALFDILPMAALTDKAFQSDTYRVRRETLRKVLAAAQVDAGGGPAPFTKVICSPSYQANSKEEIWNMYYAARTAKQEGVIVKDPDGKWEPKRSNAWLKIKAEETLDLRVIGAFEGEGEKIGTLGGLIVDFKGVHVRVGSGYTADVSDELWAMFSRDLERHTAGVVDEDEFELIGAIAEVQYQEITPAGSLRHPVFIRLRKDKNEVSF